MKLLMIQIASLLVSAVFLGCAKDLPVITPVTSAPTYPVVIAPADTTSSTKTYTYLALGDSYTIGQSVNTNDRFPSQTVALLAKNNIKVSTPIYIATTGWTTTNLINAINATSLTPPYDIVSLLIGVNDQYQMRDTTGYRQRFSALLEKAIQLSGNRASRVFVISIPDYSVAPYIPTSQKQQVSKEIDMFNAINKDITEQRNISYTDITPGSRDAASNSALIASDGLHPSGLEYSKWAMKLAPKIKAAL